MSQARDAFVPDQYTHYEPTARWVRVQFGDEFIADSKRVMLLREPKTLPVYYFPQEDVHMDLLVASDHAVTHPVYGEARYWHVTVGDNQARNAAWQYSNPPDGAPSLGGYIAFQWKLMDHWYEEEEEIFVHPRDPYKRIDTIPSSRHVQVIVGGQVVADTRQPYLLFETRLPTRYYIPQDDVRMDVLVPSDSHTHCPYKGIASYYSVKIGDDVYDDLVWYYPDPIPETPKIKGLLCFYNERVDAIIVDGGTEARPVTPWSK